MFQYLLEITKSTKFVLFTTTVVIAASYFFMKWLTQVRYFRSLNIPSGPTPLPVLGSLIGLIKNGVVYFDSMIMEKYGKDKKIVGIFEGTAPVILCTNPNMIKHVMIKDFSYFVNRRVFETFASMEPFDRSITVLKDNEWKNVRSILTIPFTSGKLKSMSKTMVNCSNVALEHIDKIASGDQYFDPQLIFAAYSIDVICSCCFGVETNAFNDPNSEFIRHLKTVFDVKLNAKTALISEKNWIQFVPVDSLKYLGGIMDDIISKRKSKAEYRNDFIQMMVDREGETDNTQSDEKELIDNIDLKPTNEWKPLKKTLTSREILSQAMVFLTAGYETSALTMSYVALCLARNPDYQKKLCHEIDEALDKHGSLSYDMVNDITYLDMVISETLRIYPPAPRLDRVASFDYVFEDIKIPKGLVWSVPIYYLHHDPEIYPDPETFIPERFTPELKKQRENEGSYMPFGLGSRNCIGLRFAILEIKIILCAILLKYEFSVCDKTPESFKFSSSGLIKPAVPITLKIQKRSEAN